MSSNSMKMMLQMMKQNSQKLELNSNTDFNKFRQINDAMNAQMPVEQGVSVTSDKICGISVEKFTPESLKGNTVILQIHGGAFCYGSLITCRNYASVLCGATGLQVYTVDYRLAPENKFPAGANDCFTVYKELIKLYPNSNIALLGESAGATLVLVVALMAKAEGIKMPSCICSYAPCVSLEGDIYPSRINNVDDPIVPVSIGKAMCEQYLDADTDPKNPFVSPIYGDYSGFPPIKLVADKGEVLADDTVHLDRKLREQGVTVECEMFEGTFHTFPATGRFTEEGVRVLDETVKFIYRYSENKI